MKKYVMVVMLLVAAVLFTVSLCQLLAETPESRAKAALALSGSASGCRCGLACSCSETRSCHDPKCPNEHRPPEKKLAGKAVCGCEPDCQCWWGESCGSPLCPIRAAKAKFPVWDGEAWEHARHQTKPVCVWVGQEPESIYGFLHYRSNDFPNWGSAVGVVVLKPKDGELVVLEKIAGRPSAAYILRWLHPPQVITSQVSLPVPQRSFQAFSGGGRSRGGC